VAGSAIHPEPLAAGGLVEPPLALGGGVACVVCGAHATREIASAIELEAQRRYLRLFHRRRLRSKDPEALEERAEFTQDYVARIVACTGCGLVYRDPQPTAETIARLYARDSYAPERLAALYQSQLELFRPKARALAQWLPSGRPVVLEVGSFVGGFLAACREAGWEATGIDPGREVADFCESKGLRVLRRNIDDVELPGNAADCIAVWNTFDQLPDPGPALRVLERSIKVGGFAVVRVPNGRCYAACMGLLRRAPQPVRGVLLAAMTWNNLPAFPYLHGYSLATLDRLFGEHGFVRVAVEGDVLTRLSDDQTKPWAAREETLLKAAWKIVAGVAASLGHPDAYPWMDVYYRRRLRD
jgi:SAM-dependent methyltransferase